MGLVYIGLGANLHDPIQHIIDAKRLLSQLTESKSIKRSSLYLTVPIGYAAQNDFVNAVLRFETQMMPIDLLECAQQVEKRLGRKRDANNQNAPRVIDVDLLLVGNYEYDSEHLTLPHPRMWERRFVLEPMLELMQVWESHYLMCEQALAATRKQNIIRLSC